MFLTYLHHIVVDGLGGYCREVRVMLFQQIVHLGRRCVLILLETFYDKGGVPLKLEPLTVDVVRMPFELGLTH